MPDGFVFVMCVSITHFTIPFSVLNHHKNGRFLSALYIYISHIKHSAVLSSLIHKELSNHIEELAHVYTFKTDNTLSV